MALSVLTLTPNFDVGVRPSANGHNRKKVIPCLVFVMFPAKSSATTTVPCTEQILNMCGANGKLFGKCKAKIDNLHW